MNEKPIERLKYYNGQRLEADDLKVEQEYHIRVRRWLNKSLYSAGIAHGLEVRPDIGNLQQVIVSPGLALDHEGREIILLEEQPVKVIGKPSKTEGQVEGNYLTIQYREETRAEESDSCTPHRNGRNKGQLAWGGPSRVRATPILGWSDDFPHESSGKIVLAQVELDQNCTVRHVYAYPRTYVGPTSLTTVRQFALEGERHIDAKNPGRIYFHIRGRQPNAVTLYLRAEQFSTLYYTEMGQHNHNIHINVNSLTIPAHAHSMPKSTTGNGTIHSHNISSIVADADTSIWGGVFTAIGAAAGFGGPTTAPMVIPLATEAAGIFASNALLPAAPMAFTLSPMPFRDRAGADTTQPNLGIRVGMTITVDSEQDPRHTHSIPSSTDNYPKDGNPTPYPLSGNAYSDTAGVTDPSPPAYSARSEAPLTYVDGLQVYIGKVEADGKRSDSGEDKNYTREILNQLKNAQPAIYGSKEKLGEGKGDNNDPLANNGTGAIRLDLLSPNLSFPEGQYYIDLQVTSGGGRILYNLYVE